LIVSNVIFLIYIIIMSSTSKSTDRGELIALEFMVWISDSIISIILIGSAIYTVVKLRSMFGNDFYSESCKMAIIMIIFCFAFLAKTCFGWAIYTIYTKTKDN
jgi:hypothetical protein